MSTVTTTASNKTSVAKSINKDNKKNTPKNTITETTTDSQNANVDGKLQPTAEQMRLANLMNDKTDFSELKTKVDKIIELTGSTRDEAIVALHDCDQNLEKAIDMVLEGDPINESEWRSSGKKKKPKVVASQQSQNEADEKVAVNGEKPKAPMRGRGGPRLQKGNKGSNWKPKEEKNNEWSKENDTTFADDPAGSMNNPPPRRRDGDNRRGRGRGSRGGNRGGDRGGDRGDRGGDRGGERGGDRGGDRGGRGTRTFQNRGYRSNVNDTFPNSIDTWTNSTADQSHNTTTVNNDCTTMTVGNWSDIAANEDWSEEDWDSNIMETKVFTASSKTLPEKDELKDIAKSSITGPSSQPMGLTALLQPSGNEASNQQNMSSMMTNSNTRNPNTTSPGAALLQQLQQQSVSQPSQMNHYSLSQYSKQATESIKSLVGIPSSSAYSTSANSGLLSSGSNLDNQPSNISQVRTQSGEHGLGSAKPQRMAQKRSTKIPESAVEMPSNDSISSLNVQFGALDFGTDNFTLSSDTNTYHDSVNHVSSKGVKGGSVSATGANLNTSLLSDNSYRNSANASETSGKPTTTTADIVLQGSVLGNQSMSETVLDRNKQSNASSSYGPKVLESTQHKSNLYHGVSNQVQPPTTNTGDISGYKSASYVQPDASNVYGTNMNYGSTNAYIYPSTTNQTGYSAVSNYSNFSTGTTTIPTTLQPGLPTQKVGLKELDSTSSQRYDMQNVVAPGAASLGLVSNSTVTTNVLKNSLTATGKGIGVPPPGVPSPLMPQYIMGQAGLQAFYPVYDVMPTATRDHNFAYTASDVKYSRADNDGSSVVSTQAPVSQTHTQPIFGQFPPGYGFFYTPGAVNMMPQSLYGAAAPLFPVTPAANAHAGSAGSAFPKGTTGYGSHSYASPGYDSLTAVPQQDYVKQGYTGGQQAKGMSASNSDLSANQMYGKSHAQLTKNYDKAGFQTGTPPPFNVAGPPSGALSASYATTPSQYIQMLPQTQAASMLHHQLQGDGGQSGTAGVGGPRSMSQSQKGSGASSSKYYNWA